VRDVASFSQSQNSVGAVGQQTAPAQLIHGILSASERFQLLQQLELGHGGTGHGLERLGLVVGPNDPQALADELRSAGVQVDLAPVDLADPVGPQTLIDTAVARFGSLDALVMSHCESVDSGLLTTTVESFDRHYAVNVRATSLLLAGFARQLPATGGSVVALTSDHTVDNTPYGATKAAMDRLVLAAAHEIGDRGLRANVINPGPIDTGGMTNELKTSLPSMQPTGRLGTPGDIANLVKFLLSDVWVIGSTGS